MKYSKLTAKTVLSLLFIICLYNLKAQNCRVLSNNSYSTSFEDSDLDELNNFWKFKDSNNDGYSWGIFEDVNDSHTGKNFLSVFLYNTDWVLTRCFEFEASKEYIVSFWYDDSYSSYQDQNLILCLGKWEYDSIRNDSIFNRIDTIVDLKNVYTRYKKVTQILTVPDDGEYRLGFFAYGINSYDQTMMKIDDFEVSEYNCANLHPNLGNDTVICNQTSINLDAGKDFVHYQWNTGNQADTLQVLNVNTSGTYTVTATDQFGCHAVSTLKTVTVYEFPKDSMIVNHYTMRINNELDLQICNKDSVKLKAIMNGGTPTNDYEIKWYLTDTDDYTYSIGIGDSIYTKEPGKYSFEMKYLASGCIQQSKLSTKLDVNYPFEGQKISYVTVDPVTGKNMIVWNKSQYDNNTEYYKIYKETSTSGDYIKIDSVPATETSYVDSGSNPIVKAERYDIAVIDTCGNESSLSGQPHKTIHLTINLGNNNTYNLLWDDYEGLDYKTCYIYRDTVSLMNLDLEPIAEVQNTIDSYTDLNPIIGKTNYYAVGIFANSSKTAKFIVKSNIVSSKEVGVNELTIDNLQLTISPNPTNSFIVVSYSLIEKANVKIKLFDLMGREVKAIEDGELRIENAGKHEKSVDMSGMDKGVYFVKMEVNGFAVVRRVVKF